MKSNEKLIVIDSNSILHRSFHALPLLTTKSGQTVNAVYGFLLVVFKAIREIRPDFICACFDSAGPTFRHKKFREYKITRPPIPKELILQIKILKEILSAFSIPFFEKSGFEADDIIGTITNLSGKKQIECIILTSDTDTLQLIDNKTKVYLLKRGVKNTVFYNENLVKEKYKGLDPKQLVDLKALIGDPSDNVPGVFGIGEKTATELIKEFGTIENLYRNLEEKTEKIKRIKPKIRNLLLSQKDKAFFSKSLVEIVKTVPIDFDLEKCRLKEYDKEKALKALRTFEFKSLIGRLPEFEKSKFKPKVEPQKTLF